MRWQTNEKSFFVKPEHKAGSPDGQPIRKLQFENFLFKKQNIPETAVFQYFRNSESDA